MMERIQNDLSDALQQLMQLIPGGVFCYDVDENQEFMFISDSMPEMFGYTMEEFRTKFNNCFPEMVYVEDRERVLREINDQVKNGNNDYCMYRVEMADGSLKWIYDRGRMITDKNGKRWFYVVIVEADELKAAEQRRVEYENQLRKEIQNRADHDAMTGLLNRYMAVVSVEKAIQKYFGGTFFLLDVDYLKSFNSSKDRQQEDQLLKDIVLSMRQLVHPEEILARIDGGQFIIFMPGNYNSRRAEKRAEEIIEVIQEVIDADVEKGGCCIGITISDGDEMTFDEMFLMAENALNRAKSKGNGKYYVVLN